MGHQDKRNFSAKHTNSQVNDTIAKKIRLSADNDCISCASAHQVAASLGMPPSDIGVQADLLEYRITQCQVGLFGYGNGGKKINPNIEIAPDLNKHLDKASQDGRISCLECWKIAGSLKIKRLDIGSACEKKNIRIKPCQLGIF
ncbi:MAG: hypothetical protein KKE44_18015 [Proteobacteria bacterium]|nr:hypothetical protein [Pseudomonadota bacterium]MBU1584629.1 hypothetical protein [Pseudomonadota bacterium]MBU2628494.1 hypothetical protein [Pseudomonadota bacterium]